MEHDVERLAAIHIKIRTARAELKAAFEEKDKALEDQINVVNEALLAICNEANAESVKTKAGTVIKSVQTRFWTEDWEAMKAFIKAHDALDLFEKRLHQGNTAQFLAEHPGVVPIGLNSQSKYSITVRKPSIK